MNKFSIIHGDCTEKLDELESNSINCCITSPPYYALRNYEVENQIGLEQSPEEYIQKLTVVFEKVKRVLKDDGTLWIVIGDSYCGTGDKGDYKDPKYEEGRNGQSVSINKKLIGYKSKDLIGIPWMLAFSLRNSGWYLRQEIIWNKENAMPESVTDRCTKSHETIFLFSKNRIYYFNNESIKEKAINGNPTSPRGSKGNVTLNSGLRNKEQNKNMSPLEKRNKRSVWTVNTAQYTEAHFATFPEKLILPCVLAGSPINGLILDPFSGAGTTGLVCIKNQRNYIGIELNKEYIDLSIRRISDEQQQLRLPY